MILLIDIFSINKGRGYENPSLEIIVTKHCSIGGFPLEEACEHCFLNQSVISVIVLISFMCYCGYYAGYITIILPFLTFYFCSPYLLYLVYCSAFHLSVPRVHCVITLNFTTHSYLASGQIISLHCQNIC
jgi:hypothetical protein